MLRGELLLPSSRFTYVPLSSISLYHFTKLHGVTRHLNVHGRDNRAWTAEQRGVFCLSFWRKRKTVQLLPSYYLNSFLFEKYFKNVKASRFFIKISLRHDIGRNSVINSNASRLVLEFSFYGWTDLYSALKMQEQATYMTHGHDKLPVKRRHALVRSSSVQSGRVLIQPSYDYGAY